MSINANVTVDAVEQQISQAIKATTANANNSKFNVNDYLDTKLKNGETSKKIKVRILPVNETDSRFCVEVKTHSLKVDKKIADSGFKSFICLNDEQIPNYDKNVKCPLCQKAFEFFKRCKELRAEGKEKIAEPLYKRACSLMNKSTYIVRVIQRGKEDEGVKFWRFNKNSKGEGIFDKLVTLYKNKKEAYKENGLNENYNIFDLTNGRDIIITITRCFDKTGKEIAPSCHIDTNDFESPLSTDESLVQKWVTDPKKWYNAYTARTVDYLSVIAEGEIPVKNSDGKWISEKELNEQRGKEEEKQKEVKEEAEKILEDNPSSTEQEQVNTSSTPKQTVNIVSDEDVEDDLPF